jgi:hypothetical protein
MTTYTQPRPNIAPLFIIGVLIAFGIYAGIAYGDHAIERHGVDKAQAVRDAVAGGNVHSRWCRPDDLRLGLVVYLQGCFGVMIVDPKDNNKEVTSFPKEKLTTDGQIQQYMFNRNYVPVGVFLALCYVYRVVKKINKN